MSIQHKWPHTVAGTQWRNHTHCKAFTQAQRPWLFSPSCISQRLPCKVTPSSSINGSTIELISFYCDNWLCSIDNKITNLLGYSQQCLSQQFYKCSKWPGWEIKLIIMLLERHFYGARKKQLISEPLYGAIFVASPQQVTAARPAEVITNSK